MSVVVETTITDYSWADRSRPIVTIDPDLKNASVQIGSGERMCIRYDIAANDPDDLAEQLKGLSEIFQKAFEVVSAKARGCGSSVAAGVGSW